MNDNISIDMANSMGMHSGLFDQRGLLANRVFMKNQCNHRNKKLFGQKTRGPSSPAQDKSVRILSLLNRRSPEGRNNHMTSRFCFMFALVFLIGCGPDVVSVEVLPPRTSATCSAPAINAAAASRGILDVAATAAFHGAYVGDLRFSAQRDGRITGLITRFTLPEGASSQSTDAATEAEESQTLGDLYLTDSNDDIRLAIWEHAVLLPRSLALALEEDDGLDIDERNYQTVIVEIEPTVDGFELNPTTSSFAIDICRGCLTTRPDEDSCIGELQDNLVCRPGQDVSLYGCGTTSGGPLF